MFKITLIPFGDLTSGTVNKWWDGNYLTFFFI
jgi:hypothetical protein